jgi:hypothetical protein
MSDIDIQLEEINQKAGAETKGERFYARKFMGAYKVVRPSLVALNKNRKEITNQIAVEKLIDVLETVLID